MIEQFKKLPEIAELIKQHEAFYCPKGDWWLCSDDQFAEAYLDGAWYAYKELHKKKRKVLSKIDRFENQSVDDKRLFSNDLLTEVKELLK